MNFKLFQPGSRKFKKVHESRCQFVSEPTKELQCPNASCISDCRTGHLQESVAPARSGHTSQNYVFPSAIRAGSASPTRLEAAGHENSCRIDFSNAYLRSGICEAWGPCFSSKIEPARVYQTVLQHHAGHPNSTSTYSIVYSPMPPCPASATTKEAATMLHSSPSSFSTC